MNKRILIILVVIAIVFGAIGFFKWNAAGVALISEWSNSGLWLFPLITIAAILDSINPCAFSVLLITVAFLISLGKSRSRIISIGGLYVIGIFLVYLLIGLGLLRVLVFFDTPHFVAKIAAVILIIFGFINLINHYFPKFPIKLKIPDVAHAKMGALMEKASLPGAFLLGAFVGLCEFPCTGGPYLLVLGLLHDHSTYLKGLAYLIYYNLVFILPLAIVLFVASKETLYAKVDAWRKSENPYMKMSMSILMILLGIIMFAL